MRRGILAAVFFVAAATVSSAQETPPWILGGSFLVQPFAAYASDFTYGSSTTLSLALKTGSGRARAEASLEAAVLTGESAAMARLVAASPYGRADEILIPAAAVGG